MLDFSTFSLSNGDIYCKKNFFKCRKKIVLFGYFWAGIWKNYCHIWNQHPRICLMTKFRKKNQKCLNLGPKMPYLGIFGLESEKKYCHIWNQQRPRIFLMAKFCKKIKMPKFGTKNALFRYFWTRIWESHCHIWNQQIEFLKNEYLTHTVNLV